MRANTLLSGLALLATTACDPREVAWPLAATEHCGAIGASETWSPADNPHILTCPVAVNGGVLTVRAGTIVRAEAGSALRIGHGGPGALVVEGEPDDPVYFVGHEEVHAGHWDGIEVYGGAAASIVHAHIRHAGARGEGGHGAALYVEDSVVHVANVSIHAADTYAFRLVGTGRLDAESHGMTISATPRYTRVALGVVHTLPLTTIETDGWSEPVVDVDGGTLTHDATWGTFGSTDWPWWGGYYRIFGDLDVAGADGQPARLTLEAGVRLVFDEGARFDVGRAGPGALSALGDDDAQVHLRAAPDPYPGSYPAPGEDVWHGLRIHPDTEATRSVLVRVEVAWAGRGDSVLPPAAVHVLGASPILDRLFIQQTTACGLYTDALADPDVAELWYIDSFGEPTCTEQPLEAR